MKMFVVLLCFLSFASFTFSQGADSSLLIKKWKFNPELMREAIGKRLLNTPAYANLDDANKAVAIQTALEKITSNRIEYRGNGTMTTTTTNGTTEGTWQLDEKANLLITRSADGKGEKRYNVVSLTGQKLHLKLDNSLELIFQPAD